MANITVTSTTNTLVVDFGTYSTLIGTEKAVYRKDHIVYIKKVSNRIFIYIEHELEWIVSADGNNGSYIVDSIEGVTPSDTSDLYTKISNLLT